MTGAEWSDLLTADAGFRVGTWATGNLETRAQQLAATDRRDRLLVQLWEDRVADAHLADLLGMSEDSIRRARERGRARGHGTGTRSPAIRPPDPPAVPRYRDLTPAETELLRAAWDHTPDEGPEASRRKWPGPQMDNLLRIITTLHADHVPYETLSSALDAHPQRISVLVARNRRSRG